MNKIRSAMRVCAAIIFLFLVGSNLAITKLVPVSAQSGAAISVSPSSQTVLVSGNVTANIQVSSAVNLNAFDITITYDPAVVALDSWSFGSLLSNLAEVKRVQSPGSLWLAYTQTSTPPVSGGGTLLTLIFRGLTAGSSNVTISSAVFSDPDGVLTSPSRSNGGIIVQLPPTRTFTPTFTLTPTNTATATSTSTSTSTATLTSTSTSIPVILSTSTQTTTSTLTPLPIPLTGATETPQVYQSTTATPESGKIAPTLPIPVSGVESTSTPEIQSTDAVPQEEENYFWLAIKQFCWIPLIILIIILVLLVVYAAKSKDK